MLTELTNETMGEFSKTGVVVIDVFAPWCGPCQKMLPVFESLNKEFGDRVSMGTIDMDKHTEYLQEQYAVDAIPTFLFYKDGIEVDRHVGSIATDSLKMRIEFLID